MLKLDNMLQTIEGIKVTWIDILSPKKQDVQILKEKFSLHPLILEELLPRLHHPKVDRYGRHLFMVVYAPYLDKKTGEVSPQELDIIIANNHIITSHYQIIPPLKSLFDRLLTDENLRKEYTDEGTAELLYRLIVEEILKSYWPKLDSLNQELDSVEKKIFAGKQKETVSKISSIKRDVLDLRRILDPQRQVFKNLVAESTDFFGKEFEPYFLHLLNTYLHLESTLKTTKETTESLENTNRSLLTIRTNEVMRVLTVFMGVIAPLTLIASIYGMNLSFLPFAEHPASFWIVSGIILASSLISIGYFKKRGWL